MTKHDEYIKALNELQVAQANFDQADPDHVDIATHRLIAAEMKFDLIYKEVKAG